MLKLKNSFFNNKVIGFMVTRYLAFGIQIINSLLLAKYLGLYFFGIYGFITLVLQYLTYSNFGINYSYQVIFADKKGITEAEQRKLTDAAMLSLIGLSVLLVLVSICGYFSADHFNIFSKYSFKEFIFPIVIIGVLVHFNNLYICIFRLFGKIKAINIYTLIIPGLQLVTLFLFKDKELLWSLVLAILIGNLLGTLLFVFSSPIKVELFKIPEIQTTVSLFKRGFFLLCYNLSFYGIIITARTLVSYFYSIEDFALFNFSNSISQAIFLLLGSLNYLFYPKLINVISNKTDNVELIDFIEKIRKLYLTLTLLIVFFSLLALPVMFLFLPAYREASLSLHFLILGQLLINNSYGYSTLLIQKGKENILTLLACMAAIFVVLISLIFRHFHMPFESVAVAVVIAVLFYNFFVIYYGNKLTRQFNSFFSLLKYIYKVELFAPVLFYITLSFFINEEYLVVFFTIGVYLVLNYKDLKNIIKECFKMLNNEKILNLKN